MSDNKKSLPCPFCGGEAVFRTISNISSHHCVGFKFEITCIDCGLILPKSFKTEFELNDCGEIHILCDGREEAIEEWNRRAK